MVRRHLLAILLVGLGFGVLAALPTSAAAPAPEIDKIAKLIEQLGSSKFDEREQASKDLEVIGVPALEALRKASKSEDAEVSRRSSDLVKSIEKRAETQIALKPTKIALVFKDTPVADAVAEIKKKTGYNIVLQDPENKLKDRKVTLDTGETTFWQAFDQFCEKAGVHEAGPQEVGILQQNVQPGLTGTPRDGLKLLPLPPPPVNALPNENPKPPEKPPVEKPNRQSGAFAVDEQPAQAKPAVAPPVVDAVAAPVQLAPAAPVGRVPAPGRWGAQQSAQITLVDGKPETRATDYFGSVRIRTTAKTDNLFQPASEGEILLGLEITAEPKIAFQSLLSVKVNKAIDDNDQKLAEAPAPTAPGIGVPAPGAAPGFARPGVQKGGFGGAGPAAWNGGFMGGSNHYAPVRLKKGDKQSKSLKELAGSISAQILAEPKALVSTDEIMKSAGKTFKGEDGGAIKIISVDKDDKTGEVKAVFEFEPPAGTLPGVGGLPGGGFVPVPIVPRAAPPPLPPLPPRNGQLQPGAPPGAALQVGQAQPAQPAQAAPAVQIQFAKAAAPARAPGVALDPRAGGVNGLKLVDDKGNAVEGHSITVDFSPPQAGGAVIPQSVLTFTLKKDQTDGGKLTYSASKSVTVDIPFNLKDVVLP
jgi:hypothetical protein